MGDRVCVGVGGALRGAGGGGVVSEVVIGAVLYAGVGGGVSKVGPPAIINTIEGGLVAKAAIFADFHADPGSIV